jgi:metal-responsive CopG/Arc/MetJ family transcriptional regulator
MKNVQITMEEDLLATVDRVASSIRQSRSAVVREALKRWLKDQEVRQFEEDWIASLKSRPQDESEVEAWAEAEDWGTP